MKIEEPKQYFIGKRSRVVHYDIPKRRIRLTVYYMDVTMEIRFLLVKEKRYQTKRKKGGSALQQGHLDAFVVKPRLRAPNHAVLAMVEPYILLAMKNYRKPAGKKAPGSWNYAELMWNTIIDRFLGGSINEKDLDLDFAGALDLKREIEEYGYA